MWEENLGIQAGVHLIELSINMGSVFYAEFGPQMKNTISLQLSSCSTEHALKSIKPHVRSSFIFSPKQPQH